MANEVMKLEKELKDRFSYDLFDENGDSQVFSINEIGDTFIVDYYNSDEDNVICTFESHLFDEVDYDAIEYLLCTTAADKYYNCPRVEIFDFNTLQHFSVPMYDYTPYETSLFDEDTPSDYRETLHKYYTSITDTKADALRLLGHHEVIQKLHREEFYDKEPVEVVMKEKEVKTDIPAEQLMLQFEF